MCVGGGHLLWTTPIFFAFYPLEQLPRWGTLAAPAPAVEIQRKQQLELAQQGVRRMPDRPSGAVFQLLHPWSTPEAPLQSTQFPGTPDTRRTPGRRSSLNSLVWTVRWGREEAAGRCPGRRGVPPSWSLPQGGKGRVDMKGRTPRGWAMADSCSPEWDTAVVGRTERTALSTAVSTAAVVVAAEEEEEDCRWGLWGRRDRNQWTGPPTDRGSRGRD